MLISILMGTRRIRSYQYLHEPHRAYCSLEHPSARHRAARAAVIFPCMIGVTDSTISGVDELLRLFSPSRVETLLTDGQKI